MQISPRCSSMTNSWRERAYMQPEVCSWLRQRRRAGRRSGVIVQEWCSRHFARDVRKRTRTCIIEFGNAEPTQVRSLTRHNISFKKPHKAKDTVECFWLRELVPGSWTLPDTKLGFWRQFGSGVLTEACTCIFRDGSGTHSDKRIRRVGWSAVINPGYVELSRANLGVLEATQ